MEELEQPNFDHDKNPSIVHEPNADYGSRVLHVDFYAQNPVWADHATP